MCQLRVACRHPVKKKRSLPGSQLRRPANDRSAGHPPKFERQSPCGIKTKRGSCNASAHRVWFNLELAKKPVQCLEYIVAHELTHLLERNHNDRFTALMDEHMPLWRQYREMLNRLPLAHDEWGY